MCQPKSLAYRGLNILLAFLFRFAITQIVTGIKMEDYAANVVYVIAGCASAMPVAKRNQA